MSQQDVVKRSSLLGSMQAMLSRGQWSRLSAQGPLSEPMAPVK